MSERIEMERLLQERKAWRIERDELRQENADLTEKINQLEVLAGELLKELKFVQAEHGTLWHHNHQKKTDG